MQWPSIMSAPDTHHKQSESPDRMARIQAGSKGLDGTLSMDEMTSTTSFSVSRGASSGTMPAVANTAESACATCIPIRSSAG